ncbi:MAG: polysaccharide pyruvyl transferase family protein [Parachlamydiaceae bacterium]
MKSVEIRHNFAQKVKTIKAITSSNSSYYLKQPFPAAIFTIFFFLMLMGQLTVVNSDTPPTQKNSPSVYISTPLTLNQFPVVFFQKIIQRIAQGEIKVVHQYVPDHKLITGGAILTAATENDTIWGTGVNPIFNKRNRYTFYNLDIRAVRGPLTRKFLSYTFQINAPEVYGDPLMLFPYFFPEFRKELEPTYDYIIIPKPEDEQYFPKDQYPNVLYTTDSWYTILKTVLNSKFVISSALYGIIFAEAYGIPTRMLRLNDQESLFEYTDYYYGTSRFDFQYATSVDEALSMGGEKPFICNLQQFYDAFPFDLWLQDIPRRNLAKTLLFKPKLPH